MTVMGSMAELRTLPDKFYAVFKTFEGIETGEGIQVHLLMQVFCSFKVMPLTE
jgi:hypothetical protein